MIEETEKLYVDKTEVVLSNVKLKSFKYSEREPNNIYGLEIDVYTEINNLKPLKEFLKNKDINELNLYSDVYLKKHKDNKNSLDLILIIKDKKVYGVLNQEYLYNMFKCYNIKDFDKGLIYLNKNNNCYPVKIRIFDKKNKEDWFIIAPCIIEDLNKIEEGLK